jgi:hypothetical protein
MKSMISRGVWWAALGLLLIAAAISVGQSAGTMLGDAEAQALIRKYQGQSGTPLTRIESQPMLKCFIAKNAHPSPSTVVQPQTQSGETSARARLHQRHPSSTKSYQRTDRGQRNRLDLRGLHSVRLLAAAP